MRKGQVYPFFYICMHNLLISLRFVKALEDQLHHFYSPSVSGNDTSSDDVVHYHYRDIDYIVEYTPLLVTYIVLFMYLYFSVREYLIVILTIS